MGTAVGALALGITGTGIRTASLIKIDDDSTGNVPIMDVNISGIYTGNVIDITYSTAAVAGDAVKVVLGTGVAASALVVTATGARTDDIFKVDTDDTSNSSIFDINHTGAFTTSYAVDLAATGNHTAGLVSLVSNSNNVGARDLVYIKNDNAAAVGTVPLEIVNDAWLAEGVSKFVVAMKLAGITIYCCTDGTSPDSVLTGAVGDLCLNGPAGTIWYCDAAGKNWTTL
jgi:hypothetical protein